MFYKNMAIEKISEGKYNILIKVSDGLILTIPVAEETLETFIGKFRDLKEK